MSEQQNNQDPSLKSAYEVQYRAGSPDFYIPIPNEEGGALSYSPEYKYVETVPPTSEDGSWQSVLQNTQTGALISLETPKLMAIQDRTGNTPAEDFFAELQAEYDRAANPDTDSGEKLTVTEAAFVENAGEVAVKELVSPVPEIPTALTPETDPRAEIAIVSEKVDTIAKDILTIAGKQPELLASLHEDGDIGSELTSLANAVTRGKWNEQYARQVFQMLEGGGGSRLTVEKFATYNGELSAVRTRLGEVRKQLFELRTQHQIPALTTELDGKTSYLSGVLDASGTMNDALLRIKVKTKHYLAGGNPEELSGDVAMIQATYENFARSRKKLLEQLDTLQRAMSKE